MLADYGDLDLEPISAGFEWHRFAAQPVLVRDHRPWHLKLGFAVFERATERSKTKQKGS